MMVAKVMVNGGWRRNKWLHVMMDVVFQVNRLDELRQLVKMVDEGGLNG